MKQTISWEERVIDALTQVQIEPGARFSAALAWCMAYLQDHAVNPQAAVRAYCREHPDPQRPR